jgi:hypothetical protein
MLEALSTSTAKRKKGKSKLTYKPQPQYYFTSKRINNSIITARSWWVMSIIPAT